MKTAEDWNNYYTFICAKDPAVHGQLLPNPQNIDFIRTVQLDAIKHGMTLASTIPNSVGLRSEELESESRLDVVARWWRKANQAILASRDNMNSLNPEPDVPAQSPPTPAA